MSKTEKLAPWLAFTI